MDLVGSEVGGGRDFYVIGVIDIALGYMLTHRRWCRRVSPVASSVVIDLFKAATERAAKGGLSIGQEPLSDRTLHGEFFHLALEVGPDGRVGASLKGAPPITLRRWRWRERKPFAAS